VSHYTGSVPETEPAPSWHKQAECGRPEYDDHRDLWYAADSDHAAVAEAISICRQCPVIQACARAAFRQGESFGIWGGMTARQRTAALRRVRALQAERAAKPKAAPKPKKKREPAKCGTRSGYLRHRKNGEEACAACRQANTDADNRLRRTGTTKAAA
jgi:hypothetical protein